MFKDTQARYESLSARIMKLQVVARSLWHSGNGVKAVKIANVITKMAEVRLKYIYQ